MRILYCGLRYDYGVPSRGASFEHANFYDTLTHMPVDLVHFEIDGEILRHGYIEANRRLRRIVDSWQPHMLFSVMFEEQLDFRVVQAISKETDTVTVGWFCDDHWRFDGYSRYWAHALEWAVTTDFEALPKYQRIGAAKTVGSQWACNQYSYRKQCDQVDIDVSFVGQPHGRRASQISRLRRDGREVLTRGQGWPEGRASQAEMVDIFCRSRVNLNLSASSKRSWPNARAAPQIKGRVFEVPGCGGLLLTEWAPHLDDYYVFDEEIAMFRTDSEMRAKVRALLNDEPRRASIAVAGYKRTLSEHTYDARLMEIIRSVGLLREVDLSARRRTFSIEEVL